MDEDEDGLVVISEPTIDELEARLNDADACISQLEDRVRELQGHVAWMTDKMRAARLIDEHEGHHAFTPL